MLRLQGARPGAGTSIQRQGQGAAATVFHSLSAHRKATLCEPLAVVWHMIAQDEAGHMNMLLSVSLRVAENAEIIPT